LNGNTKRINGTGQGDINEKEMEIRQIREFISEKGST
jgi:hypothetical protein